MIYTTRLNYIGWCFALQDLAFDFLFVGAIRELPLRIHNKHTDKSQFNGEKGLRVWLSPVGLFSD